MAGPGPQPLDRRQAWFGPAYVAAIMAQAGYPWEATAAENDVHSFDGSVIVHPGSALFVQVKCFRGTFKNSKSYRIKDAWRKNWSPLLQPAYFVAVEVPEDVSAWIDHERKDRSTLLNASAYWTRIDPLLDDQKSIQVTSKQRFTAGTIKQWRNDFYAQAVPKGLELKEGRP